jgi:nicotinate-nucleotide pyrophosphorylase (carboxylating)
VTGPVPPQLTPEYLRAKVAEALEEDLGPSLRDVTSESVVPPDMQAEAHLVTGQAGVVAGRLALAEVCRQVDERLELTVLVEDGTEVQAGSPIAALRGSLRAMLRAERTALNFVQQLSGVATLTRRCVEAAAPAVVLDTRKTVPGLRPLQRYAVAAGGGANHRYNLAEAVLVKDNHLVAAGGVAAAVKAAHGAGLPIEVEVAHAAQVEAALEAGADLLLLDNMTPAEVGEAVAAVAGRVPVEVSGGVTLANLAEYAAAGADRISIGALTHSAPALDISMEVLKTWR